jgi:hypothetical protein
LKNDVIWKDLFGVDEVSTAGGARFGSEEVISIALVDTFGRVQNEDATLTEAVLAWLDNPPVVMIQFLITNRASNERFWSWLGNRRLSWLRRWWRLSVDINFRKVNVDFVESGSIQRFINLHYVLSILLVPSVFKSMDRPAIKEVRCLIQELAG